MTTPASVLLVGVGVMARKLVWLPFPFDGAPQSRLSLDWREWMTNQLLEEYFADRSFYQLQAAGLVDSPDQRLSAAIK